MFAAAAQIALVGFAVAAFFHPIAYQFYFFCVAGLAVAVKNVVPDRSAGAAHPGERPMNISRVLPRRRRQSAASPIRLLKVVPTFMCGGTENQFMALGRSLDPSRFALEFACLRRWGAFADEIEQRQIPLLECNVTSFRSVSAIWPAGASCPAHRHGARSTSCTPTVFTATCSRCLRRDGRCAGGHRIDSRSCAVPDADAEARATLGVPVCGLRPGERHGRQGMADRRGLRRFEDRRHPEWRRVEPLRARRGAGVAISRARRARGRAGGSGGVALEPAERPRIVSRGRRAGGQVFRRRGL